MSMKSILCAKNVRVLSQILWFPFLLGAGRKKSKKLLSDKNIVVTLQSEILSMP